MNLLSTPTDLIKPEQISGELVDFFGKPFYIKDESTTVSGVMKFRKCLAAYATALMANQKELHFFTNGNVALSYYYAREWHAQRGFFHRIPLVAHVNHKFIDSRVIGGISEIVDRVVDSTSKDYEGGVNEPSGAEEAYRTVILEIIESGVIPTDIVVPVGSGEFAHQILIGMRWIAVFKWLLQKYPLEKVMEIFNRVYPKRLRVGYGESRIHETKDFNLIRGQLEPAPSIDELLDYFPKIHFVTESGNFFSYVNKIDNNAPISLQIEGRCAISFKPVVFHFDEVEERIADKLKTPLLAYDDISGEDRIFGSLNKIRYDQFSINECRRDEILDAWRILRQIGVNVEPSSATAFAGFKQLVEKKEVGSAPVVVNTGMGLHVNYDSGELIMP